MSEEMGWAVGLGAMIAAPFFLLVVVGGGLAREHRRSMRREVERLLAELPRPGSVGAGRGAR